MNSSPKQESAPQFINRFLNWVRKQGNTGILYRGLANKGWEVSSSLYRRLRDSKYLEGQSPAEIDQILKEANKKITERAEQWHHRKDGVPLNTLQIWAELQHYGAATALIDFTRNPLVALWFACQNETGKETDGKVIAIDSSDENKYKIISENENEQLTELFKGEFLWKWQPPKQNNRIISQHSEFVLGKHVIKTDDEFPILREMKKLILAELEKHDISEEHLFCDFYGFTQINAHNRSYNYHTPTYTANAKQAAQSGDYEKAIELYNHAIEHNQNDATLYNERGTAKGKLGDFKDAIIDFDNAIKLKSKYAKAYFNRGLAKINSGKTQGAIIDFDKALKLNPKDANAYFNRGYAKNKLGEFNSAIIDYNKVLEINLEDAGAYNHRGIAKSKLDNFKDAIVDYDKALELDPKYAEAYNNRGVAKDELGTPKGAIIDYDKALELDPEYAEAYNNRGVVKDESGDPKNAIIDYDKALELNPQYADAYNNRGVAKSRVGDIKNAIVDYDKALELNPQYVAAYYNRGNAKGNLGDFRGAIMDYNKVLELNPDNPHAYYNRGIAKYALGDKKGALADIKKARELDPTFGIPPELSSLDDSDSE